MVGGGPEEGNVVVLARAAGGGGEGGKAQRKDDVEDEKDENDDAHRRQAHRARAAEQAGHRVACTRTHRHTGQQGWGSAYMYVYLISFVLVINIFILLMVFT